MASEQQKLTEMQKRDAYQESIEIGILRAIKNQNAPFFHNKKAEDMPRAYNVSNGMPYKGLNSLLLDIKKEEFSYENNQWISLDEAKTLGASADELQNFKDNWRENYANKAVKIHYPQTTETKYVFKRDENGNKIPKVDDKGNIKYLKDKETGKYVIKDDEKVVLYEVEMKKVITKNGKEIDVKVTEKVPLPEPKFRTELLYNVDEFKTIDRSKFKELNQNLVKAHILRHIANNDKDSVLKVMISDLKLNPETMDAIQSYMNAQSRGFDYEVPKGLNQKQKEQVEKIVKDGISQAQAQKQEVAKTENKEVKQEAQKQTNVNKPKAKGRGR